MVFTTPNCWLRATNNSLYYLGFSLAGEKGVGATLKSRPACGSSRTPADAFPSTIKEVRETANAETRNRIGQLFIHGRMDHQRVTGPTEEILL